MKPLSPATIDANDVIAKLEVGMLAVPLPKAAAEKPRRLTVNVE